MNWPTFDSATAYLVAGFLYVATPLAAWFVMGKSRTPAAGVWCAGSVSLGCASFLLAFRTPEMPGWMAYVVMNALLFGGNLLQVAGLRLELGLRVFWRSGVLAGLSILALLEFFRLGLNSPALRLAGVLLCMGALLAWTARLAWQIHQREASFSARWLTQIYTLGALLSAVRAARVLWGVAPADPLTFNWDSVVTIFSVCVMSVFGSVAVLGLYLERSVRRDLQQAVALEKEKVGQAFALRMAHWDRQRSMGELAAALAHELAQPLTVVSVECGLLKRELKDAAQAQRVLVDNIHNHVDRATHIVRGIRNFMRPAEPDFQAVHMLDVVEDVRHWMDSLLRERQVQVFVVRDPGPLTVQGDFIQLSQVVLNVLRNAMEAQMPGRALNVQIDVRRIGERLVMAIEDDGPGFSEGALSQAGLAFSSTKEDGMGIGIAISRRIAEQHGGTLVLANRTDGQGARVVLDLPISLPDTVSTPRY